MIVPYLPSLGYYRTWMRERIAGLSDETAWRSVFDHTPKDKRRGMARTLVAGAHGQHPLLLSLPVVGGGSELKRGHPEDWHISMHGRWAPVHLGALDAAYSSTPFYAHLRDELRSVLMSVAEGDSFTALTTSLHLRMMSFLDIGNIIESLRGCRADLERITRLAAEKSAGIHTDLTFLDVICRRGREAVFPLLLSH